MKHRVVALLSLLALGQAFGCSIVLLGAAWWTVGDTAPCPNLSGLFGEQKCSVFLHQSSAWVVNLINESFGFKDFRPSKQNNKFIIRIPINGYWDGTSTYLYDAPRGAIAIQFFKPSIAQQFVNKLWDELKGYPVNTDEIVQCSKIGVYIPKGLELNSCIFNTGDSGRESGIPGAYFKIKVTTASDNSFEKNTNYISYFDNACYSVIIRREF